MVNSRETVGAVWTESQQLCPRREPDSLVAFPGGTGKAPAAGVFLVMVKGGKSTLFVAHGVHGPQPGLPRLSGHEHHLQSGCTAPSQQPHGQCQGSVSTGNHPTKVQLSLSTRAAGGRVCCAAGLGAPRLPVCCRALGCVQPSQERLTVHGQGCSSHCCELFAVFKIITGFCSFDRTKNWLAGLRVLLLQREQNR